MDRQQARVAPIRLSGPRGDIPYPLVIGRAAAPQEDLYHFILSRGWGQFFALVAFLFLCINGTFALIYWLEPGSILNARARSYEDAFYFSVQTMATIGYGAMAPATRLAHVVVTMEAIVGMVFTALVTGLTFAKFARPTARVLFSEKAVISVRDGVPHLMFRMANWRHNTILEANLRVAVLVPHRTREGEEMRMAIDLPLVRERTALFVLTWTAMHRIDERSPFYGPDALPRLRSQRAEIFLSLTGTDETLAQTVHARYRYQIEDVEDGVRFADVVTVQEDGTRIIDYRNFHKVVALAGGEPR